MTDTMTPEERARQVMTKLFADLKPKPAETIIARAIQEAIEAEREACAKVAEQGYCTASGCDTQTTGHSSLCPLGIAAAIRARGEDE